MTDKRPKKIALTQEQWDRFQEYFTPEVKKRLYHEAYRIVRNKPDAEDALWLSVELGARYLKDLSDEKKFYAWMWTIVRREAYRILRREKKLSTIRYAYLFVKDHYYSGSTPDALLISKDEIAALRRAIDQLDPSDKQLVLMKLQTEKTLKEIAMELNLNYHTTRSKYTRARKQLYRILTSEEGDGSHEEK